MTYIDEIKILWGCEKRQPRYYTQVKQSVKILTSTQKYVILKTGKFAHQEKHRKKEMSRKLPTAF